MIGFSVKHRKIIILLYTLLILQGCGAGSASESSDTNNVASDLVGEWVYVDNGEGFYLKRSATLKFTRVDNNLIEIPTDNDSKRYAIRKGISNSSISGNVQKATQKASTGRASYNFTAQSSGVDGIAGIDVILKNLKDDSIQIETTTDQNGNFNSDSVPTGDYSINIENENSNFETNQNISGPATDLGVLNLNDKGEYNFKASLDIGFVYGDYQSVRGDVVIENIGTKRGTGLSFTFDCSSNLHKLIQSCDIDNNSGSIEPNKSKSFPITIAIKFLSNNSEKISIPVLVRDVYGKEWNDYVLLTVYKRPLNINIQASSASVRGYLISPGHLPLKISTSSNTVKVPYLPEQTYQLVFANNSIRSETTYSVGIDTSTNTLKGFNDTSSFEPNNSESEATQLTPLKAISSYLHIGDIDYYTIDMPVDSTQSATLEFYSLVPFFDGDNFGDGDGVLSKGETIKFDFAIKNSSFINVEDVIVEISSEDPFITVGSARKFSPQDFDSNTVADTEGYYKGHEYFGNGNSDAGFIATASVDTPENHKATINVTMTDKFGNQWFDTFQFSTQKTSANLAFNSISELFDNMDSFTNGNNDSILNQGETARFNLAIENTGSSAAINTLLEISTNDQYLTVENASDDSRRVTSIQPSTIVDSNTYVKDGIHSERFLKRSTTSGDFSVTSAADTPAGHTATINLKMTDTYGNIWTDSFEITVEDIAADLKFHSISELFDSMDSFTNGNNDSILNQGETARFNLAIENTGSSAAINTLLEISTNDQYLTVENASDDSRRVTSIQPSTIVDSNTYVKDGIHSERFLKRSTTSGDFSVTSAADTPAGHTATINLKMTDTYGNIWTDSFEITVEGIAADLKFHDISPFFDKTVDDSVGNDDSILNAGEIADITVAIKNTGTSPAIDMIVELESLDSQNYISVINDSVSGRTQTAPGNSIIDTDSKLSNDPNFLIRDNRGDFRIQTDQNTPSNYSSDIQVVMTDKFGNTWTDTFTVTVE